MIFTKKTGLFEVFSKTLFDDPFEKSHDGTKSVNGSVTGSERGQFVRFKEHTLCD